MHSLKIVTSFVVGFLLATSVVAQNTTAQKQPTEARQQQAIQHAEKAQDHLEKKDAAAAIAEMKKALALAPNVAEYYNQLALAYYHNKQMNEMWIQLRKGSRIDPSHELLAKGLVAYWQAFDKQGLFNTGSSGQAIRQALGKPDSDIANPSDKSRTRLIYGFLAVELHDDQVHQILDLRGLTNDHFQPQEIITVDLDGRGWSVAYRANNRYTATAEYTLPNERIQEWTELVSIQRMHRMGIKDPDLEQVAEGMMTNLRKTNPDAEYRFLEKDDDSVLLEWKTAGNENGAAQHEIVRLFKSSRDLHRIAYVQKTDSLDKETRERWVKILKSAVLKPTDSSP